MTAGAPLVLFDIDGTIIRAGDPAHRTAFEAAMAEVYGVAATLDGIRLGGRLDRQIARDSLRREGLDDARIDGRLDALMTAMGRRYASLVGPDERRAWVLPGVETTAAALADLGARVGVLTGGARPVARHKLAAAGLGHRFPIGAYGCEADERSHLVALAVAEAAALGPVDPRRVVLVGDTPLDIEAARLAGAVSVAVATGRWSVDDLAEHRPDVLLADLTCDGGAPPEVRAALDGVGSPPR